MTASDKLVYHWINKDSPSTSLTSATGSEATAMRGYIQRLVQARTQDSEDGPVTAPTPQRGLVRATAKGKNPRCNDDAKCKRRRPKLKVMVVCSKHYIRWRLAPSSSSRRSQALHYRRISGVPLIDVSSKLEPDPSDGECTPVCNRAILTAEEELFNMSISI